MSSGERNRRQSQGMSYGASVAGENVDFATDTNTEPPGTRDRALLDKLKDALKPGDARRFSASGSSGGHQVDTTHDGRHGGIEEAMHPGHRDYDERSERSEQHENPYPRRGSVLDELGERGHAREDTTSYPYTRRGSVLDELGERATARETGGRRPSVIDELGDRARARETGTGTGRRGSIFERMPFGLGQRQPEVGRHEEGQRGGGGGVMNSMRRTSGAGTGGVGSHEHYRDSTDMSKADERHLPGTMYHTIRDDLLK